MNNTNFTIRFSPEETLKEAESQMQKAFRQTCNHEINTFFSENERYIGRELQKNPGAGLLLIRDFLEKKFDNPKTLERMEAYFDNNFDRIMEEAMQKALQHKANGFVFGKAAKAEIPQS